MRTATGRSPTGTATRARTRRDSGSTDRRRASVLGIADAPDKPVYLITGSDRPKVETAIARLRAHFEPEAIELVSALDVSGEETVGLCNAGSLFGDARLILVTEVDGVRAERGRRGGWKSADVEAVTAYLESPAPASVLALVSEELKASTPLWKACEKRGRVLAYDVVKRKLHEWVASQFRDRGVRAEPDAVAALVQLVGEDLRMLKTEVDKIATWAGDEPVGEREVEALVASSVEVPIYELTEAWSVRDTARVLALSETYFERERQRRDAAAKLAGALVGHLGRLRSLKQLASEGVKPKEAAERLKLHPFRAQKLYGQAEGFSDEELDDAVIRLAALDGALKGQSKLTPDLELQRTLVALSQRPAAGAGSARG